jgi:hypothetical protein
MSEKDIKAPCKDGEKSTGCCTDKTKAPHVEHPKVHAAADLKK